MNKASLEIQLHDILDAKHASTIEQTKDNLTQMLDSTSRLDVYQYGRLLRSFDDASSLAAWLDKVWMA